MTSRQYPVDYKQRHVLISRNCLAVILHRTKSDVSQNGGHVIFSDFLQQNSMCFWNSCLSRSVSSLEYRGYLVPCTLLISGTDFSLEVVRSAWARRVLRPPKGFTINKLGDISILEMIPVPQTQFAPLSEALCKVVADLNSESCAATTTAIKLKLEENFPEMQVPSEDILLKSLANLMKERKLFCSGNSYHVTGPEIYKPTFSTCERQMLMTNEEAIVKLHGNKKECSLAIQVDEIDIAAAWNCSNSSFLHASKRCRDISCQINQVPSDVQVLERSQSLKIMRLKGGRPKGSEEVDRSTKGSSTTKRLSYLANELNEDIHYQKGEKQSMLAKILKRMQSLKERSDKHITFSAQFPPLEWKEPGKQVCHSVATQTSAQKIYSPSFKTAKHKIPWEESEQLRNKEFSHFFTSNGLPKTLPHMNGNNARKSTNVVMRQSHSRHSPSHRYSYGTLNNFSKRRSRHKRSSSESPKLVKNHVNGKTRSPEDNNSTKLSPSSSSGSAVPANLKAIVTPRLRTLSSPHKSKPIVSCNNSSKQGLVYNTTPSPNRTLNCSTPGTNKQTSKDKEVFSDTNEVFPPSTGPNFKKELDQETQDSEADPLAILSDAKLALSETSSELSISFNCLESPKIDSVIQPPVLKSFIEIPKIVLTEKENRTTESNEIIIDNTVSVEVTSPPPNNPKNNNLSTIVTEETTVTKGKGNSKIVTVTSITTSLSHGKVKDIDYSANKGEMPKTESFNPKATKNDLNFENGKLPRTLDCSSSCNIVTEVK